MKKARVDEIFADEKIKDIRQIMSRSVMQRLFPDHLELVPQINDFYELELAFYESQMLSDNEIIKNGAYFARVGDVLTRHFLICSGEPIRLTQHYSLRLKSFFKSNQFKTGYATHGLFPYRGKFHPQMIKGLINCMNLKPGDVVLDPMMGSGTVLIEACLMGIKSFGIDTSPFCRFMSQTKVDALTMPIPPIRGALKNNKEIFEYFKNIVGQPNSNKVIPTQYQLGDLFSGEESTTKNQIYELPDEIEIPEVYNFCICIATLKTSDVRGLLT